MTGIFSAGERTSERRLAFLIAIALTFYVGVWAIGFLPAPDGRESVREPVVTPAGDAGLYTPPMAAVAPFVILLLSIALLPLSPATAKWWDHPRYQLLVAVALSVATLVYYLTLHPGGVANEFTHHPGSLPGLNTVLAVLSNALLAEYLPFIALLFSLYVVSGGIHVSGNLAAHPLVNCAFLGVGALLASVVGTTGAAMILIRPLLQANKERTHRSHTVVFFIFVVCNCGGLLLPTGDPPLFLGYLRGVPFTWTLRLWPYWIGVNVAIIAIYYLWERRLYRAEPARNIRRDERLATPLRLEGARNFLWLVLIVLSVAVIVPDQPLPGTPWIAPPLLREAILMLVVLLSIATSDGAARARNGFTYHAILEVAALFSGIFICLQVPIEILSARGSEMGLNSPLVFFWTTGLLSGFLDNAPTYIVFFEMATALPIEAASSTVQLLDGGTIAGAHLTAISLGAVLMGALTYVGNGPNFMVRSIAAHSGVAMPSFFRFMMLAVLVLFPIFGVVTWALS